MRRDVASPKEAGALSGIPRPHLPPTRPSARHTADPVCAALLALLDRAGRAVADARRAVASGADSRAAVAELAVVAELAEAAQAAG